jgi:hypothetical protein
MPSGTVSLASAAARSALAGSFAGGALLAAPNAPPGEYVVVQYHTAVGGGRTVVETIAMQREGSQWREAGYYVRP